MRFLCFLFLIVFAGAVAAFAWFNNEVVSVRFFEFSVTTRLSVVAGAAYALGMFSGWSVVGMVRRSIDRVSQPYRDESTR